MPIVTEITENIPKNPMGWDFDAAGRDEDGKLYFQLYNFWWPAEKGIDRIYIELEAFREGRTVEMGGLGRFGHLQECVELLWNHGGKQRVEWNPWMEKMLRECCETYEEDEYLAVAGCSSSSKSFGGAVWVWVNWLADPENTLGLVSSTSIQAAKKRIWRSIVQLYNGLPPSEKAKARYRPSLNMFQWVPPAGVNATESSAICLVAAEAKQEAAASAKLIGAKNKYVIFAADELAELSHAILSVAIDNLPSNDKFHMVSMSNPKDREDPFGVMSEPIAGWDSIDERTFEWKTKFGRAIRFDCLRSPNYLEREKIYHYMLTYEKIEKARELRGENSPHFFRFFRGFFPIQGAEDVLYTEVDFSAWMREKVEWGKQEPVKVAGLDPSFSSGGDLTILSYGLLGTDTDGKVRLQYEDDISIKEDAQDKRIPRTDQIWKHVKAHCDRLGIEYKNLAVDNTGAGRSFCDRGTQILSHEIMLVEFGGKASELPVSAKNRTESFKKFANRVSELWGVGMEYLRGGQFAGLRKNKDLMSQLKARRYEEVKGGDGIRVRVESKKDMKLRTGRSPDNADAFFIMLDLCRVRHHFRSEERGLAILPETDYLELVQSMDIVTLSSNGVPDWVPMSA